MTRKEAKEEAIAQLERISRNLASIGETVDYTEFAIEALEQTDVLDKVRAEIAENGNSDINTQSVLAIIDKYRKEQGNADSD